MIIALQQQISHLEHIPGTGDERVDAIDRCISGIDCLQKEVQAAVAYVPASDQRIYSQVNGHLSIDVSSETSW